MKDEIQQYIDNNIVENPNIDLSKLSVLTQPDELHYLASVVNWDIHMPILEWIVKQAICSEATALMIFWQAQPQDFTVYRWNETQIKEDITVFHLIKIIIIITIRQTTKRIFLLFPILCIKTLKEKNHIVFMMNKT